MGRLLKKAHLQRWRARALVAAYVEYASLGPSLAALSLDLFEQPAGERFLRLLVTASDRMTVVRVPWLCFDNLRTLPFRVL